MTRIRSRSSSMISDRRGGGGLGLPMGGFGRGGGFGVPMGGGLIGIIVLVAVLVLPRLLGGGGDGSPSDQAVSSQQTCDEEREAILCGATIDVQDFWQRDFAAHGETYEPTKTVFFSGYTDTGCGQASAETGPFYCPADQLVYLDLDFLDELQRRFDAPGDLATQYIVAHEYGHHVQDLLGTSDRVRRAQQADPSQANALSVALELQADCYAGVWAHDAASRDMLDSPGEVHEALDAAAAVGDDRIQRQTQGRVDPESFTHGTSEQRMTWFQRGFDTGDRDACDTFAG